MCWNNHLKRIKGISLTRTRGSDAYISSIYEKISIFVSDGLQNIYVKKALRGD